VCRGADVPPAGEYVQKCLDFSGVELARIATAVEVNEAPDPADVGSRSYGHGAGRAVRLRCARADRRIRARSLGRRSTPSPIGRSGRGLCSRCAGSAPPAPRDRLRLSSPSSRRCGPELTDVCALEPRNTPWRFSGGLHRSYPSIPACVTGHFTRMFDHLLADQNSV
jgi:hypothetical protein